MATISSAYYIKTNHVGDDVHPQTRFYGLRRSQRLWDNRSAQKHYDIERWIVEWLRDGDFTDEQMLTLLTPTERNYVHKTRLLRKCYLMCRHNMEQHGML